MALSVLEIATVSQMAFLAMTLLIEIATPKGFADAKCTGRNDIVD